MNFLLSSGLSATVDVVALIFVGVFALWGFMRGFTKTFFSAFGSLLSLLFAVLLCSTVTNFLQDKFSLVDTVSGSLGGVLSDMFGNELMNSQLKDVTSEYLVNAGLSGFVIDLILSSQTQLPLDTTLNQIICPTISYYIVLILSVVALYIIFKFIFYLLGEVVKKMHGKFGIGKLDKALGLLLGATQGIIYLELIIMVIKVIPIALFQDIYLAIQASTFTKFVETINLYNLIIEAVIRSNVIGFIKGA